MNRIVGYIKCKIHGKQKVFIDGHSTKEYRVLSETCKTALCPICKDRYPFFEIEVDDLNCRNS